MIVGKVLSESFSLSPGKYETNHDGQCTSKVERTEASFSGCNVSIKSPFSPKPSLLSNIAHREGKLTSHS